MNLNQSDSGNREARHEIQTSGKDWHLFKKPNKAMNIAVWNTTKLHESHHFNRGTGIILVVYNRLKRWVGWAKNWAKNLKMVLKFVEWQIKAKNNLAKTVIQSIRWLFKFWRTSVLLWEHWYPCFGLLVLDFKVTVDPLACMLCRLCAMDSSDSPLVQHLLTSWQPGKKPTYLFDDSSIIVKSTSIKTDISFWSPRSFLWPLCRRILQSGSNESRRMSEM